MKTDHVLPLDGFSHQVKDVILHFSEVKKAPANYMATALMATVGALVGKNVKIVDGGYVNYPQMFACLVGRPNGGKTPAISAVLQPINAMDGQAFKEYTAQLSEWRKNGKNDGQPKPQRHQIIASNFTFEKLFQMLSYNGRGLLWVADEMTDLMDNLNRYSKGNNLPALLSMWANTNVSIDRKCDESLLLEEPFLSMLTGTQPATLNGIFAPYLGRGFFSRFLFVLPDEEPEKRVEPNQLHLGYWARLCQKLRELEPITLEFAADARMELEKADDVFTEVCRMLADTDEERADYMGKQSYNIRRIAGIVHLISPESGLLFGDKVSSTITAEELKFAFRLVEFFGSCANQVLETIGQRQVKAMTDKQLLQAFNERFRPDNISELARMIGKSQPYLCKILKN